MCLVDCTINIVRDIVFVIENSNYIGSNQFRIIREFVNNITINLKLISPESSVGVILFDNTAHIQFNLKAHTNLTTLSPAINPGLPFSNRYGRDTAAALRLLLSSAQNGSLGIRNDTSNIAIVITGGPSNNQTSLQSAAAALHAANIFDVYAIGFRSANMDDLNTIASGPDFVYFINSFYNNYEVEKLKVDITDGICSCKCLTNIIILLLCNI